MTKRAKKKESNRLLNASLAAGGIMATLIGTDWMASKFFLDSIVETPPVSGLTQEFVPIPTIVAPVSAPEVQMPTNLPERVKSPTVNLVPIPTVAAPNEALNVAAPVVTTSELPVITFEVPQVAVPNIPAAPASGGSISLDLAPIPSVTVPSGPVTTTKTSK